MSSNLSSPSVDTREYSTDVACNGRELIVPRGGDISQACMRCGGPTALRFARRLSRARSGDLQKLRGSSAIEGFLVLLELIQLLIFLLSKADDLTTANDRKLTYGLCARHAKVRRLMLWSLPISVLCGIALLVWVLRRTDLSAAVGLSAIMLAGFMLVSPIFTYFYRPGPRLSGENPTYLWIKGCGKGFLDAYSEQTPK